MSVSLPILGLQAFALPFPHRIDNADSPRQHGLYKYKYIETYLTQTSRCHLSVVGNWRVCEVRSPQRQTFCLRRLFLRLSQSCKHVGIRCSKSSKTSFSYIRPLAHPLLGSLSHRPLAVNKYERCCKYTKIIWRFQIFTTEFLKIGFLMVMHKLLAIVVRGRVATRETMFYW